MTCDLALPLMRDRRVVAMLRLGAYSPAMARGGRRLTRKPHGAIRGRAYVIVMTSAWLTGPSHGGDGGWGVGERVGGADREAEPSAGDAGMPSRP